MQYVHLTSQTQVQGTEQIGGLQRGKFDASNQDRQIVKW